MSDFSVRVGMNIRKYRELQEMTIEELASKLGMSQPNLSKIERGEPKKVDYVLLERISNVLEVDQAELTGWGSDKEKHTQHLQHRVDKAFEEYSKLSFENQKIVNNLISALANSKTANNTDQEVIRKLKYISNDARERILHQLDYEYEQERKKQSANSKSSKVG